MPMRKARAALGLAALQMLSAGLLVSAQACVPTGLAGDPSIDAIQASLAEIQRQAAEIERRALERGRDPASFLPPIPRDDWSALSAQCAEAPRLEPLPVALRGTALVTASSLESARAAGTQGPDVQVEQTDQWRIYAVDLDRDGRPELAHVFDLSDRRLGLRLDRDRDGWLEQSYEYAGEEIVGYGADRDRDGVFERRLRLWRGRAYERLADGNLDQRIDARWVYQSRRVVYEEHDLDGDGRFERRLEYLRGRRDLERVDDDGDGLPERFLEYGSGERPARIGRDLDRDGIPDTWQPFQAPAEPRGCARRAECRAYVRALGRRVRVSWDRPRDLAPRFGVSFRLDESGSPYGFRIEPRGGRPDVRGATSFIFALQLAAPFRGVPVELAHVPIELEVTELGLIAPLAR